MESTLARPWPGNCRGEIEGRTGSWRAGPDGRRRAPPAQASPQAALKGSAPHGRRTLPRLLRDAERDRCPPDVTRRGRGGNRSRPRAPAPGTDRGTLARKLGTPAPRPHRAAEKKGACAHQRRMRKGTNPRSVVEIAGRVESGWGGIGPPPAASERETTTRNGAGQHPPQDPQRSDREREHHQKAGEPDRGEPRALLFGGAIEGGAVLGDRVRDSRCPGSSSHHDADIEKSWAGGIVALICMPGTPASVVAITVYPAGATPPGVLQIVPVTHGGHRPVRTNHCVTRKVAATEQSFSEQSLTGKFPLAFAAPVTVNL